MKHQIQPLPIPIPIPIPKPLVNTFLALLAILSLAQGATLDDKYCRVQNSTLTDQMYSQLSLPAGAKSACALACRSEAQCDFWAFEAGTCQLGCYDCPGATAFTASAVSTEVFVSQEKGERARVFN